MVAATATDMVGKDVTKNRSSLQLFLTPDSMNTFLNDAAQQLFNMWATPIGKKLHNRAIAYAYRFPILDPQGSRDQFYFGIEKYYGSSDHVLFVDTRSRLFCSTTGRTSATTPAKTARSTTIPRN